MWYQLFFFALFYTLVQGSVPKHLRHDDDVGKTPIQMIQSHGYPTETHHVTTEDGYILEIYRIPYSPNPAVNGSRGPVLMVHGLMSSAADYVNMGPDTSLAYLLADNGHDVWLLNCRGTTFSKKHVNITDPARYYNFSWHEMGYHDVPDTIDYVLAMMNHKKLFYIGHSQGNTAYLVMASTRPEYNDKIHLATLLAPPALMSNCAPSLHILSQIAYLLQVLHFSDLPGIYGSVLRDFGKILCVDGSPYQDYCAGLVRLIIGENDGDELNMDKLPAILTNAPNDASAKQYMHYAQLVNTGKFRYYDYGVEGNMEKYGTSEPPEYDLQKITSPLAVYYSKGDDFVAAKDVKTLIGILPNVINTYEIAYDKFTHFDYLFAKDVVAMLYDVVMNNMASISIQ